MSGNFWTGAGQRRIGRRTLLRGATLGAAGLAGAALIGCGEDEGGDQPSGGGGGTTAPGGTGTAAAASSGIPANITRALGWSESLGYGVVPVNDREVVRGGTFRTAATGTTTEQDPELSIGGGDNAATNDRLFMANGWTAELIPDLLESWEVTDAQGLEYTLTLREGIKTHDIEPTNGRIFTAEDVAWGINRKAGKLDAEEAKKYLRAGQFVGLNRAEAVDERTVKIFMDSPNGAILNTFTHPGAVMVPRDQDEIGYKDPLKLVGTGAWLQTEFVEGTRQIFKANPEYYRQWDEGGRPGYDTWEKLVIADRGSQVASFITGELGTLGAAQPHEEAQLRSSVPDAWWVEQLNNGWIYFGMNPHQATVPYFADQRVWRAFQLSMDYEALGVGFSGDFLYTGPVPSMFPEAMPSDEVKTYAGYNPDTKEQDIAEALRLLDSAGYPNGAGMKFIHTVPGTSGGYFDTAVRQLDHWNTIFPEAEIELLAHAESAPFVNLQVSRTYDTRMWQYASVPDAALEVRTYFHSQGGRNYEGYSDPQTDEAIDNMIRALSREERIEAIRPFERRMLTEGTPLIPLFVKMDKLVYQPNVGGFDMVSGPFAHVSYPGGVRWFWGTK